VKRRLLNALAVASLVLFIATAALWVASGLGWHVSEPFRYHARNRADWLWLISVPGELRFYIFPTEGPWVDGPDSRDTPDRGTLEDAVPVPDDVSCFRFWIFSWAASWH
jgi:hypothetical protein